MTDDTRDEDWAGAVAALPRGAAVIVRHRDARAREKLAHQLRSVCDARRIKLLIAGDEKLALRVRADGVHMPERGVARLGPLKMFYPRWLVTGAAHGARSIGAASRAGADAALIAPVFATTSHLGRAGLGTAQFCALATVSGVPVYALGGVDALSVGRLAATPICGVALIGGWIRS